MGKKENDYQIKALQKEITILNKKLEELNENTIVQSMNDMKHDYEELLQNSVCLNQYEHWKEYYTRYFNMSKTVEQMNSLKIEDLNSLLEFIENYNPEIHNYDANVKATHVNKVLRTILNNAILTERVLRKYTQDEFESAIY